MEHNPQLVRLLLSHGANVDDSDEEGWTSLAGACASGDEEICRILLEAGADINSRDNYGHTPLYQVGHVSESLKEFLLEMGAELR
jgi:ankyrin repeat protein